MAIYVLDAFAIYAYFKDEPGAEIVGRLLNEAEQGLHQISVATVNAGEANYKLWREFGPTSAAQVWITIRAWPVSLVNIDIALSIDAAAVKAEERMGYMDCFVIALAKRLGATIVTGDSDFAQVEGRVPIEWLPRA